MDLLNFPAGYFQTFFLVFMRVAAMVMTLPIFSSRNIPAIAKIGLSALLAFAMTPTLPGATPALPPQFEAFVLLILQEVLLGLVLGFAVQIVFNGIQMAGQVLGVQMGLNIATTFDPLTQAQQVSHIDQLYGLVAGLVFLTINGHHWVIQGLHSSFTILPIGAFALDEAVANDLIRLVTEAFVISIRIGMPVMATLLITDIAFLIVGRTAPQMNIFFVGQPVKIGVGLIALFAAMPVVVGLMSTIFRGLPEDLTRFLRIAAG